MKTEMKTYKGPYTIYYTMHYKNVKQCNMEEQALAHLHTYTHNLCAGTNVSSTYKPLQES